MSAHDELRWLPGWRVRELFVAGDVSAAEIVEDTLARIEALDAHLHAFLTVDADGARAAAQRLDSDRAAGNEAGPLAGVPVAIKDQIWTAGIRTTAGSRTLIDHVPSVDSPCVARLREAGAIVIGKTNTPEFGLLWRTANLIAPETLNPWDLARTSGGSSGGSAVAVASGMVPIALGADGAGSTRLPSAFCGTFGLLPSLGRVPRFGVFDGGFHHTGIGPMTRDIRDAAVTHVLISGPDGHDPTCIPTGAGDVVSALARELDGLRLAWWGPDVAGDARDERVVAAARAAAERLAGDALGETDIGMRWPEQYYEAFHRISSADRYARLGQQRSFYDDPALRGLLTPGTRARFAEGAAVTGAEYARAMSARAAVQAKFARAFEACDVILAPTTPFVAPVIPRGDLTSRPRDITAYTYLANMAGVPAASVPCGEVDGLPVGLQVIGPMGGEERVLRVCRALERIAPWADRRPPEPAGARDGGM